MSHRVLRACWRWWTARFERDRSRAYFCALVEAAIAHDQRLPIWSRVSAAPRKPANCLEVDVARAMQLVSTPRHARLFYRGYLIVRHPCISPRGGSTLNACRHWVANGTIRNHPFDWIAVFDEIDASQPSSAAT